MIQHLNSVMHYCLIVTVKVFDERLLSENSCDEMSITEGEVDQVSHNVLADHYCCTYYCITGSS